MNFYDNNQVGELFLGPALVAKFSRVSLCGCERMCVCSGVWLTTTTLCKHAHTSANTHPHTLNTQTSLWTAAASALPASEAVSASLCVCLCVCACPCSCPCQGPYRGPSQCLCWFACPCACVDGGCCRKIEFIVNSKRGTANLKHRQGEGTHTHTHTQ